MLNLTVPEVALLKEILTEDRHELMTEINRTDSLEYKQSLQERRRLLDHILVQLGAASQPPVSPLPGQAQRL
ncbi:MAG TPA: hypothetical protein VGO93_00520 [Candidatus Xenobia bacterium]|jgi:hypothetical protein